MTKKVLPRTRQIFNSTCNIKKAFLYYNIRRNSNRNKSDMTWADKGALGQPQVTVASERPKRKIIQPKHLDGYV